MSGDIQIRKNISLQLNEVLKLEAISKDDSLISEVFKNCLPKEPGATSPLQQSYSFQVLSDTCAKAEEEVTKELDSKRTSFEAVSKEHDTKWWVVHPLLFEVLYCLSKIFANNPFEKIITENTETQDKRLQLTVTQDRCEIKIKQLEDLHEQLKVMALAEQTKLDEEEAKKAALEETARKQVKKEQTAPPEQASESPTVEQDLQEVAATMSKVVGATGQLFASFWR